jgi:HAD superfamily hydrolase (TIGR01509 family)
VSLNLSRVHTVIFDLGGVLLNLDPDRTRRAMVDLGIGHFEQLFTVHKATELFNRLETGGVEPRLFVDTLIREADRPVTAIQVVDAWNAMLLDYRQDSLRFIEQLKQKRHVLLFSNTNAIHYEAFQLSLRETTPWRRMEDLFHTAYFSHILGRRKPEPTAYEAIVEEQELDPAATLFIDDNLQNVLGARTAGLMAYHLLPGESVEGVLGGLMD